MFGMIVRWLITLALAGGVLYSALLYYGKWAEFNDYSNRISIQKSEVARLAALKDEKLKQQEVAGQWRGLMERIQTSGFDPKAWVSYPVGIESDLDWAQAEELLLVASNGNSKQAAYWFQPEYLSVRRIEVLPPAGEAAAQGESEEAAQEDPTPVTMLNVVMTGNFLMPK